MVDYNTYMQTAAAIGSAVAAAFAATVARNAFNFQKNLALKQVVLAEIVGVTNALQNLLSLTGKVPLAVDDSVFINLPQKITSAKCSLVTLQSIVRESTRSDVTKVLEIVSSLNEFNIFSPEDYGQSIECATLLREGISVMEKVYRAEVT